MDKRLLTIFLNIISINLLLVINSVDSIEIDYCRTHRYQKSFNTTYMQFTKEALSKEYADLGQFKGLHCCAKGYRTIEWFKDGKPYPWAKDVSSLILYPESANQTIYTRETTVDDFGIFTCVLRNETHKTEHHLELKIPENTPDIPLATYQPKDQYVNLGETARFYCEAFVGKIDLPDAKSDIFWYQIFDEHQENLIEGEQEIIERDDGKIVGAYLIIPVTKPHSYGRYICRITMGNDDHRIEMSVWLFGKPFEAVNNNVLSPIFFATIAAILTLCLIYIIKFTTICCVKNNQNQCKRTIDESNIRSGV